MIKTKFKLYNSDFRIFETATWLLWPVFSVYSIFWCISRLALYARIDRTAPPENVVVFVDRVLVIAALVLLIFIIYRFLIVKGRSFIVDGHYLIIVDNLFFKKQRKKRIPLKDIFEIRFGYLNIFSSPPNLALKKTNIVILVYKGSSLPHTLEIRIQQNPDLKSFIGTLGPYILKLPVKDFR